MTLHPELNPGDIITMNVDYGDGSEIKIRPALVISKNLLHQNSNGFVFLGITSKPSATFTLSLTNDNMEDGRLDSSSNVIYDKLVWAQQSNIRKKIGHVKKSYLEQVMALIKKDILN